jgi:predicted RNase H-like nuclease (RuvC/YqgF family)
MSEEETFAKLRYELNRVESENRDLQKEVQTLNNENTLLKAQVEELAERVGTAESRENA